MASPNPGPNPGRPSSHLVGRPHRQSHRGTLHDHNHKLKILMRLCTRRPCHRLLASAPRGSARLYASPSIVHEKPYYLTTPIFYPNSGMGHTTSDSGPALTLTPVPHIGHLYTLVTTDIISRHARLAHPDRAVHFLTGTDEHGLKIQRAAEEQDLEPRLFCDRISDRFRVCSYTCRCISAC